uniref:myb/SANT-like DNA-binding domain-containing protein 3 n=1 Tax=Styela clava TaxID=7725 RepID=UPI00193AB890|nr:myb/SANT-like DNA-binding domain-containing protein 3 [Styela clava]
MARLTYELGSLGDFKVMLAFRPDWIILTVYFYRIILMCVAMSDSIEKQTVPRIVFTDNEKINLVNLVEPQIRIIESKKNDINATCNKSNAWAGITDHFNALPDVKKYTAKQLKKCWMNMKSRAKVAVLKEKKSLRSTGGGPSKNIADELSHRIYGMIPEQFDPLYNDVDSDTNMFSVEDFTMPGMLQGRFITLHLH